MSRIRFGTDGWRDLMYDAFTLPNVARVVRAVADYTIDSGGAKRGIVVGYDSRFFSDFFALQTAAILKEKGIKVYTTARDLPTPVVAFAVRQQKAFGAIIFTASHNPPAYNGIKFIPEYAGPASPEVTAAIERRIPEMVSVKTYSGREGFEEIDPVPAYLEGLDKLIDREAVRQSGLEIGYDPMYGTGREILDSFFEGLTVFHDYRNPLFGGGMPDPQGKYLQDLIDWVQAGANRIGLATDGDADRFGVVDEGGVFLTPNQVLPLILYHLVVNKKMKGVVGRTVATTHLMDALASDFGLETVETPVGFKYLGALMRERQVVVAGEESGGLSIGGHIPEKDGILACGLLAELRAMAGKPLQEILKDIWSRVGSFYSQRLDLQLSEEKKSGILERLKADPPSEMAGKNVVELKTEDGFKFLLNDGSWCLIRPSGTESLIRVYLETHSPEEMESLKEEIQSWLASIKTT